MPVTLCVFDAYGTLFDVAAAARDAAAEEAFEEHAGALAELAETWRQKQLGYTWLRASYGCHTDFWAVTTASLDFALEFHELDHVEGLRDRLLQLYWELKPYEEVQRILAALRFNNMRTAILSNGAPDMLEAAVESARLKDSFDAVISAEQAGVFKPHPKVYDLVGQVFGVPRNDVLFMSSNCWDACCATAYGFRTLWVNRRGDPLDRLHAKPTFMADSLVSLPRVVETL